MGRAAIEYAERGLAVFMCQPNGKAPNVTRGVHDATTDTAILAMEWEVEPWGNVGMACGEKSGGLLVIDLDVHEEGHNGVKFLEGWEEEHGELPETWEQVTGSGGRQLFYRAPRGWRNRVNGELGVDVRGEGGYVIVPPSVHPCGDAYEWSVSPDDCDLADADETVYAFLEACRPATMGGGNGASGERFELPETIAKGGRDDTLYRYGCSLRAKGLGEGEIRALLSAANETRCETPLPKRDINRLARQAASKPAGRSEEFERAIAPVVAMEGERTTKHGRVADMTSRDVLNLMGADPYIAGRVKWDVLARQPWKVAPLPWDMSEAARPLTDNDLAAMFGRLEWEYGLRKEQTFKTALRQFWAMPPNQMNRMADAMDALPVVRGEFGTTGTYADMPDVVQVSHDGGETWEESVTKAGTLFSTYLGAEMSEYTYEVELLALRELVARATHPGCKADYMVVFAGAQGIGKSVFVQQLAPDDSLHLGSFNKFDEEHCKRLSGKLVVEMSEMAGTKRSGIEEIKQVLTAQKDNVRALYAELPEDRPRTAVFFGTTNDTVFLKDSTGNRRFLPVDCGSVQGRAHPGLFDGSMHADAMQALGEVKAWMAAMGERAFLRSLRLPEEVEGVALEKQDAYQSEDQTAATIAAWLDTCGVDKVNVKMVALNALDMSAADFARVSRYVTDDIARAITRAGWTQFAGKQRVEGYGITRAWARPGSAVAAAAT